MSYSRNKKAKIWLAFIIVIAIFAGCIGAVAYFQKGNIEALSYVKKYSGEERRKMLEDNEKVILDILKKLPEVKVQPLDEKAEEMLRDGKISQEDAVLIITGRAQTEDFETDVSQNAETPKEPDVSGADDKVDEVKNNHESPDNHGNDSSTDVSGGTNEQSHPQPVPDKPSELENLIAQIYILRADFSGQLDSLVGQAKAEYIANKGKNKAGIAGKYLRMASDLEGACDSQMESILSKIDAELKSTGGDSGIISEIRSAYENEKSIKKADLLAKYNK